MASQVDEQLNALQAQPAQTFRGLGPGSDALPGAPGQQALLEKAAGKPFQTFWRRYLSHLRKDLCLPGGILYEQWHKWKDLQSKSAVKVAYGALAGMGIPTASLGPAAVAAAVVLLNVALKVGIDTLCEGCKQEGENPDGSDETKPDDPSKTA